MSRDRRPSIKVLSLYWILAIASCFLIVPTGSAVWQDVVSFRSCNVNSSDLSVSTCGKASLNSGDGLLVVLFLCVGLLAISLLTHAWRLSRRMS